MKKVVGFIFIAVATVLSLAAIVQIPKLISVTITGLSGNANAFGYLVGTAIFFGILVAIIYFLTKYGLKLLRKSPRMTGNREVLDADLMTNNVKDNQL